MDEFIKIRGARQHNLKNLNLDLPKNKLVVITGVSGSGKSSLAFDTIYAEGQRRYVESLSAYARQFLGVMDKPEVDSIEGLSPAIAINQSAGGRTHNPRSTVGTVTEIYDYLRLLFARVGHPHCQECGREIERQSVSQITEAVLAMIAARPSKRPLRLIIFSPVVRERKGEFGQLFENLKKQGFRLIRLDGKMRDLSEDLTLIKTNRHSLDVVIDRLVVSSRQAREKTPVSRIHQSVEQALKLSDGSVVVSEVLDATFSLPEKPRLWRDHLFSEKFACPSCNLSLPEVEPRTFSFNSPAGACQGCTGLGFQLKVDPRLVLNPNLTVNEGGILPWSRLVSYDSWFRRLLLAVAVRKQFSLDERIGFLPEVVRNFLLYGDSTETFVVSGLNRRGHRTQFSENFEGVIPNLERRYRETQSEYSRSEIEKYLVKEPCPDCQGTRLKPSSLGITILGQSIADVVGFSVTGVRDWVQTMGRELSDSGYAAAVTQPINKEILSRLNFLIDVGLDYLTLNRPTATLAGGELQRIRLASQIGSGLSGVVYVLDEPSIGLHSRDQEKLIQTLKKLRDLGNTVIVIEHDKATMLAADFIVDVGPGAGEKGGYLVSQGSPKAVMADPQSLTGRYLSGRRQIELSSKNQELRNEDDSVETVIHDSKFLTLRGCREHNLKNIDVAFPLGKMIGVIGVSGSGKSTLINDTLHRALKFHFGLTETERIGAHDGLAGVEFLDKVINIDQSPIGRTPRSNPVTYIKTFDQIRALMAVTPAAKMRGYSAGRFSFNVKGGRCEVCQGDGQIRIEMQFLSDVYVTCESCAGRRYNSETLEVEFNGRHIAEILDFTVEDALAFFGPFPGITRGLQTLADVGLGYIRLGQSATTLSGGEAQRVKLSLELAKKSTGRTLYLLDEPTTGLHFADIEKLLLVLRTLVERGNTVIIIEHNLDVVGNCDYLIELGPGGGSAGGQVIFSGSLGQILPAGTPTAESLRKFLKPG